MAVCESARTKDEMINLHSTNRVVAVTLILSVCYLPLEIEVCISIERYENDSK